VRIKSLFSASGPLGSKIEPRNIITDLIRQAILNEMAAQMDDSPPKKENGVLASQTEVAQWFKGALMSNS
jgi:hypothetical protein